MENAKSMTLHFLFYRFVTFYSLLSYRVGCLAYLLCCACIFFICYVNCNSFLGCMFIFLAEMSRFFAIIMHLQPTPGCIASIHLHPISG